MYHKFTLSFDIPPRLCMSGLQSFFSTSWDFTIHSDIHLEKPAVNKNKVLIIMILIINFNKNNNSDIFQISTIEFHNSWVHCFTVNNGSNCANNERPRQNL